MAINKVKTTEEEQHFKFLSNQSSILRTVDTNNITVNGVNVIVDKPKRGDIMCIDFDPEVMLVKKVVWIDGLSINLKQLSGHYEAIGICLSVKGNKALVRYREERDMRWLAADYWVLESRIVPGMKSRPLNVTINGVISVNKFSYSIGELDEKPLETFRDKLNTWFRANNYFDYIAQLEDPNTLVVYGLSTESSWKGTFGIEGLDFSSFRDPSQRSPIECIQGYYLNNDFFNHHTGGCCRAKFYDYIKANQVAPTGPMNAIASVPNPNAPAPLSQMPATKEDFEHNSNCKFLRDHFADYDEYLESWMTKFPCGAGGTITEFPCGKENTYKLADCTFLDNATGAQSALYPAANWAASISLNAPKLGKGNWWLPSAAEIVEIMRDITYGSHQQEWEANPDIINLVLQKLTSIDNSGWSMLSSVDNIWTSTKCSDFAAYWYEKELGTLFGVNDENEEQSNLALYNPKMVSPITIYEF